MTPDKMRLILPSGGMMTPSPRIASLIERIIRHAAEIEALGQGQVRLGVGHGYVHVLKMFPDQKRSP